MWLQFQIIFFVIKIMICHLIGWTGYAAHKLGIRMQLQVFYRNSLLWRHMSRINKNMETSNLSREIDHQCCIWSANLMLLLRKSCFIRIRPRQNNTTNDNDVVIQQLTNAENTCKAKQHQITGHVTRIKNCIKYTNARKDATTSCNACESSLFFVKINRRLARGVF